MFGGNQQPQFTSREEMLQFIIQELDEIKRYVAGTYQNVDTEIQEIRDTLRRIEQEVKDNDRQLDKMERYEQTLRNIENTVRKIERKK